jgi:hypothetical protein
MLLFAKKEYRELYKRLKGRKVRCVKLRDKDNQEDRIIGEHGYISFNGSVLIIVCEGREVLRQPLEKLRIYDHMSLDGSDFVYSDKVTGEDVTAVVYYEYYRK